MSSLFLSLRAPEKHLRQAPTFCAWVEAIIIFTLINRCAKEFKDFFENWLSHVRFVINLVEYNLSHVWKLNERNVAGGFGYSANCSILIDDIIDIVAEAACKSFEILNLFIEINNRANLLKGIGSLFLPH